MDLFAAFLLLLGGCNQPNGWLNDSEHFFIIAKLMNLKVNSIGIGIAYLYLGAYLQVSSPSPASVSDAGFFLHIYLKRYCIFSATL
jgi:hypothetical protein